MLSWQVSGDPSNQVITVQCTVTNLAGTSSDQITVETVGQYNTIMTLRFT